MIKKLEESSSHFLQSVLNEPLQSLQPISQFSEAQLLTLYSRLLIKECCLQQKQENKSSTENYKFMKKRLEDFMLDSAKKNNFDWLNLPWKASPSAIEESYRIVIKLFHPDRIDKNMPEDLKQLCHKCFISITKAYNHLTNQSSREKYINQVETGSTEDLLDIYTKYNKGKSELQKDNFQSALKIFNSLLEYKKTPGDTLLYYIWAKLKANPNKTLSHEERDKILKLFDKVQTKYQKTDIFFFTKGLFMKSTGYRKAAFEFFTKATKINPRMIKSSSRKIYFKAKEKKEAFLACLNELVKESIEK